MQSNGMIFSKKLQNIELILVWLFWIYMLRFAQDSVADPKYDNFKLALFIPSQVLFWWNY